MKKLSILLICTLILFSCCKDKDDDKKPDITPDGNVAGHPLDELGLPYATTEGLNTMGCLINGEPWLAIKRTFSGNLVYQIPFSLSADGQLNINALREYDGQLDGIRLSSFPVLSSGIYGFDNPSSVYLDGTTNCGYYNLDSTYINEIHLIRVDFDNQILSGRFQFRAINNECDTLTITNGRFDLSS